MEKEAQQTISLGGEITGDFCAELREELDDYRHAINQNMDDLGTCYEFVQALDRKIERLTDRLDELAMVVAPEGCSKCKCVEPLSEKEKNVFSALYASVDVHAWTSFRDLAKRLNMGHSLLSSHLAGLVQKGIPILKRYSGGAAYVGIDEDFKRRQAKTNFLKVSTPLSHWMQE